MNIEEMKIAIYLRVSSRERALLGYGLGAQKEKDESYIKLMFDTDPKDAQIYIDDGVSAKDMKRKDLMKMLKDVEEGKINVIVIYKLDRLARSVSDVYKIISFLIEHNCNLVAVMDHLDIQSANGRMIVGILAVIAQWEREVDVERTLDGLDSMAAQGKFPLPGCPFGWKKDEDKYLQVDSKSSAIINFLGDMIIQGYTLNDLCRVLYDEYKISKQPNTIKTWLLRSYNTGKFMYHEKLYDDIVPAIMTDEKQQEIKKGLAKRTLRWDTDKYYYANLVHCSCGGLAVQKLTKKKTKKYYYYECPSCYKRINQTNLLHQTLDDIFFHSNTISVDQLQKNLNKRINSLNKKVDTIYKRYVADLIDVKAYAYSLSKLQEEKNVLQAQLSSTNIDAQKEFNIQNDMIKRKFIQSNVSKVIVDLHLKMVLKIEFKTIMK
ncbi:recombinase family protein [Amedibacillus sp. YH-ame6]